MKQEDYGILQKALKYKSDKHDENANILKNDANIETNDSPPTGILKNRRKSCDVSSITGHGGIPPPIKINSENQNVTILSLYLKIFIMKGFYFL